MRAPVPFDVSSLELAGKPDSSLAARGAGDTFLPSHLTWVLRMRWSLEALHDLDLLHEGVESVKGEAVHHGPTNGLQHGLSPLG